MMRKPPPAIRKQIDELMQLKLPQVERTDAAAKIVANIADICAAEMQRRTNIPQSEFLEASVCEINERLLLRRCPERKKVADPLADRPPEK
jgi:hypothetical protein